MRCLLACKVCNPQEGFGPEALTVLVSLPLIQGLLALVAWNTYGTHPFFLLLKALG